MVWLPNLFTHHGQESRGQKKASSQRSLTKLHPRQSQAENPGLRKKPAEHSKLRREAEKELPVKEDVDRATARGNGGDKTRQRQ